MSTEAWFHRVKAAQRDLIRLCGGIERAAEISSISKSHIGRMNNAADPEIMPLPAIIALEADCGQPVVTAVMAGINGRRLTDPEDEKAAAGSILTAFSRMKAADADLTMEMANAMADGDFTPSEILAADRKAALLQDAAADLRASFAGAKARGGVKATLRVVGGDE
jgi:hypothetical protein